MFVHQYILTVILIFAIVTPLVTSHVRDYGFWIQNAKKFVYALKHHYETYLAPGHPLPKGYKMEYTRPNPWLLLGHPSCIVGDWEDYVKYFILDGEDPKVYFDKLYTYPGYPGTLAQLCLNVDSFPTLRCESSTPGATIGTGTCKCLQYPDPRHKHTPYSYVPDPKNPTAACLAQEGSICDLEQNTIKCASEFLTCNTYDKVCGSDAILYNQALVHSLNATSPEHFETASDLVAISRLESENLLLEEILQVSQHPVNHGENGCNLKLFQDVSSEIVELMAALSKDPPEFKIKYDAFMSSTGTPAMTGLQRSLAKYEALTTTAQSVPSVPLTAGEIKAAKLTRLCLDNFPATRCLDTKSPEAMQSQSLTATPTSNRYMLDGDCVCADDKDELIKTPLFRFEKKELPPQNGEVRFQCTAKPNSSCDTISGPVPCAVYRPGADEEVQYTCSPWKTKSEDYDGGIPYIYSVFEFWVCQNLENEPETEEEILRKLKENGSQKLTLTDLLAILLLWTFIILFV